MAILDRVKERVETDLSDPELQSIIDEANQDIINKLGPHADPAHPITERLEGRKKTVVVSRQIDKSYPIAITEYVSEWGWGETVYTLNALDYRIWPDGYVVERLVTGPNAWSYWTHHVEITYTPVNDGDQREEVIIKMAILAIGYDGSFPGLRSLGIGDVHMSQADYSSERDKLIYSLAPRGSLGMV